MTFGKRLKKARTERHMTQKQLADLLSVKHNSISNWENDINKPDPDTIELICGILDITPNFLLATSTDDFSPAEKLIIKKYRALDAHGKEMVDFTLQKEWERSTHKVEEKIKYTYEPQPISFVAERGYEYGAKAAHNDHADEPGEQEKMLEDISNLKRPE